MENRSLANCRTGEESQVSRNSHISVQGVCPDQSWSQETQRHHSVVSLKPLNRKECDGQNNPEHQCCNHRAVVPRFCLTAPLQSQRKADERRKQYTKSREVKLEECFFPRCWHWLDMLRYVQEEENQDHNRTANWQIDPETPLPASFRNECASHERAKYCREHKDPHPCTDQYWTTFGLRHVVDHKNGTSKGP